MGVYDDMQAELDGKKPSPTVRVPNASTPIPQGPMDRVKGFLKGVKDVTLPFAINAAQPLTAGYRDTLAAKISGRPEAEVKEAVANYLGEHSNKVLDAAGHMAGGIVGDVGTGILGRAALPSVFARPGVAGGGISGGAVGAVGGVRDAWQDLSSGDPNRVKQGIGDALISTVGGIGGGAASELISPLVTWGGRVGKSRMTPLDAEELLRLRYAAADAKSKGYNASLPEMARLSGDPMLKHELAPRLEGIMESGAKGQPGIRGALPDKHTVARMDLDRPSTGPQRAEWEARTSGPNNFYASAEEATREAQRAQLAATRVHGDKPVYSPTPLPPSVERLRTQVAKESREGMEGVPPTGTPERARSVVETAIDRETNPLAQRQAREVLSDQNRRLADKAKADNNLIDMQRHLDAMEIRPAADMTLPAMTLGIPGKPFLRVGMDKIPGVQAADRRAAGMLSSNPLDAAKRIGKGSAYTPWAAALAANAGRGWKDLIWQD